jgi:multiple sugar transport system ATP-binding protein
LRVQMRAEILKVHRAVQATAVYVTHDQIEAMTMGDRIAIMSEGIIQQVGIPEELYDHPVNRFVAGFIGTPAMGFLRVSRAEPKVLRGAGVQLHASDEQAAALPAGTRDVIVGVRPEHLRPIAPSAPEAAESTITGVVRVVEPLGPEQHVLVAVDAADQAATAGGGLITARLPRADRVTAEEPIAFTVRPGQFHMFDADTGKALR